MDNLFSEIDAELRRKQIMEERDAIRLEEEATKGKHPLSKNLVSLGEWMIAVGERLRKQHSYSRAKTRSAGLINRTA